MKKIFVSLILSTTLFFTCQKNNDYKTDKKASIRQKLENLIQQEYKNDRFHGTILIAKGDTTLYQKAIGKANRVWDIPMELNHRFDIASLNKSFIAAMILIAVEEGHINLESKLSELLEKYEYTSSFNEKITIHQLLTHSSGLPDYGSVPSDLSANSFIKFKRKKFSNKDYVAFISKLKVRGMPESQFYYSNFAYHLLCVILEEIYNQPLSVILKDKICLRLGLKDTFIANTNEEVYKKVVEAYNYDKKEGEWNRNNFIDLSLGRRVYSSVIDLYTWSKAMKDTLILSQNSLDLMQKNHLTSITKDFSYGYGWVVFDGVRNYKMGDLSINKNYIIHGGATEGFKSMLVNINRGEYVITFLSNVGDNTNELQLTKKIVGILLKY